MSLKEDFSDLNKTEEPGAEWKTVAEFAKRSGWSEDYTRKVLQKLVAAGRYEVKKFGRTPLLHYRKRDESDASTPKQNVRS